MQIRKLILMPIFLLTVGLVTAQESDSPGIYVSQVESQTLDYPNRYYNITVEWDNAWHTEKNHDAAWVFIKYLTENGSQHIPILKGSAKMLWKGSDNMPSAAIDVSSDGAGIFVYASEKFRGDLKYRLQVKVDTTKIDMDDLRRGSPWAYGIEMVYIPKGGFTLGSPDSLSREYSGFYKSGENGEYAGLYTLNEENEEILVGPEYGNLYYEQNYRSEYRGDQRGVIPVEFPKGVDPFYIMKYEVSQGDYVHFLNTIGDHASSIHFPGGVKTYRKQGGTIHIQNEEFIADRPEQRMMFWHWDDMMAYADWAALRPYTEFEFTKAVRGPSEPIPGEYAWNTNSLDKMARRIDSQDQLMKMNKYIPLSELNDENREIFGASYYWVFDLSGSMWEKVITVGDSVGRAFKGQHGDGNIYGYYGNANVEGWPSGFADSEGGYGYRGGGYYGENWISDTNPYPAISYRRYSSWSGGPRNSSYGFRAARTAD